MSIKKLEEKIFQKKSSLILKLDGIYETVPSAFMAKGKDAASPIESVGKFGRMLIDILEDIIPAVILKPMHYWLCGKSGAAELEKTLNYAKTKGLYTILDIEAPISFAAAESLLTGMFPNQRGESHILTDSISVFENGNYDMLQQLIFSSNKISKPVFLTIGSDCNTEIIGEMARQAAPVFGYSNLGIYLADKWDNKNIRKELPQCFILCRQHENTKKLKEFFGNDGGGAAVCISPCNDDMAELSENEIKTKIYEDVSRYNLKINKIKTRIMDDSLLL